MIISASRRTDIPAFFSEWFFNRLRDGYVYVRNPVVPQQVSSIDLSPEVVDGIVFWTKNPIPMLDKLDLLKDYMYYFQFTLTSYGQDVECGVPNKSRVLVPAFQRLSNQISPERVIWRYDPIFLSKKYTVEYHIRYFEELARRLAPYTERVVISFLNRYERVVRNMSPVGLVDFPDDQQIALAKSLVEIAHSYGLEMQSCAETLPLSDLGIVRSSCIDGVLLGKLLGCPLTVGRDKNQRTGCGCMESIDIGEYSTCRNGCRYCYANQRTNSVPYRAQRHDPNSPLLIGEVGPEDRVSVRKVVPLQDRQLKLAL